MTDVANREITPLQAALEYHLWNRNFRDPQDLQIALKAVVFAQVAADRGDPKWLDQTVVNGQTVAQLVRKFHLDSFVDWGGGEIT